MSKFKNTLLATLMLLLFSNVTTAQALTTNYSVNVEEPVKVKYLGDDGEFLLFQVTLPSNETANAKFVIYDKNVGELYSTRLASNVSTIKIEKKEQADQVLNFKVVLGKKTYSKSFSVTRNLIETTTVAERDITKL